MTDQSTKLGHADHRLLICLSEDGGWTAGEIAKHMGYLNVRSHAQILRRDLLRMEALGWVGKLDDNKPTAWIRTPAGTEALNRIFRYSDLCLRFKSENARMRTVIQKIAKMSPRAGGIGQVARDEMRLWK